MRRGRCLFLGLLGLVLLARGSMPTDAQSSLPYETAVAPGAHALIAEAGGDPILVGAGDIASSGSGAEATARLLDVIPGTVATFGDNAYDAGTDVQFADYYDPTWGRHKARTMPSAGNHDYDTPEASGYFNYFGAAAGEPEKGYYSYNLGAWHIVALNSNCSQVGGCNASSAQEQWLRADLAANPATCIAAYWHHPLYSSGSNHGSSTAARALYQALYDFGAEVVMTGHEHNYERFAPQNAFGQLDLSRGIRQFVVGTGGAGHYVFLQPPIANMEARDDTAFGVLKLTLHPTSYDWQFVPEAGESFTDSGSASCSESPDPDLDTDADGFTDTEEAFMGTDPARACPNSATPNDEDPDAWPPDFNDDRMVDVYDLLGAPASFRNSFGASDPDPPYYGRYDLSMNGTIDVLDLLGTPNSFKRSFGTGCTP
jgi:hypothetical protein